MTHVVTEACIRCKYTAFVEVCPVDAFREGMNMLLIDPIDCRVCIPECPVDAIYPAATRRVRGLRCHRCPDAGFIVNR